MDGKPFFCAGKLLLPQKKTEMEGVFHKIEKLRLEHFTCFERAEFEFSPGINVLIGENGTGKTHILKVAYWAMAINREPKVFSLDTLEIDYFRASENGLDRDKKFQIYFATNIFEWETVNAEWNPLKGDIWSNLSGPLLFLPPYEMLSWQQGFINLWQRQETGFDRTWFDLAVALDGNLLKGKHLEEAIALTKTLEKAIGGQVVKRDGRFFLQFENEKEAIEAPLVAQGINKLAQLIYLILNGSLTRDSILFWDEPETNLNPKYVAVVARFIQALARAGVQIFVATHDYLLTHLLSLAAEYKTENGQTPDIRFFSLYKTENGTAVESGSSLAALSHNVILDEYARLHDYELDLYQQKLAVK